MVPGILPLRKTVPWLGLGFGLGLELELGMGEFSSGAFVLELFPTPS